jgi:hypothetical protein
MTVAVENVLLLIIRVGIGIAPSAKALTTQGGLKNKWNHRFL